MDDIQACLQAGELEKVIELTSQELKAAPSSTGLLLTRSTAYLRLKQPKKALEDAEAAVVAADPRDRGVAQLRRAISLNAMGEGLRAKSLIRFFPKNSKDADLWAAKLSLVPGQADPLEPEVAKSKTQVPVAGAPRKDWFQSSTRVTITLYVKDIDPSAEVKITQSDIELKSSQLDWHLKLAGTVDPAQSSYTITPFKVEFQLHKETSGSWSSLEKLPSEKAASVKMPFEKSWDRIDIESDSDNDNDDPNAFFKKIYQEATPDVKRAMMKSYVESNGTTLSTNWDEVKRGKVETQPPSGMEAKRW